VNLKRRSRGLNMNWRRPVSLQVEAQIEKGG
jgi:hypothetical protein